MTTPAQSTALFQRLHRLLSSSAIACVLIPTTLAAEGDPLGDAGELSGTGAMDPREVITDVMIAIVKFTALLAVIAIIIGGVYMIVGGESGVERGKRILLYTIVGVLIILIAGAVVSVFVSLA
ncbi:hypothetical protein COU80_00570 [Candidatus Peregrinibacteria bacterium CG10_big_fil_rev_8_21_14_0_10_55_24]|nr:MAG: hypothetical protein COU80_00570 [Candidatus Peregrinibacteria bacterium CG10_big_fil_rev_8_21_14_0_10_55_24]